MTNEGAGEGELRREMVKACRYCMRPRLLVMVLGGHLSTRIGD
jgi:hypothetical protein